jgi:hypothetical protein
MRTELKFGLVVVVASVAMLMLLRHPKNHTTLLQSPQTVVRSTVPAAEEVPQPSTVPEPSAPTSLPPIAPPRDAAINSATEQPVTNKLERLHQIRDTFTALAAGNPATALREAKKLTDENERETALLTLVTEWTHGELGPAQRRARLIAGYGLEAGLAIELASKPELAMLWADELTVGPAREAVYENAAVAMLNSDPAAALALNEKLPELQRRNFLDAVFSTWASADTDAALKWADQMSDPAEKDAALAAIRTAAPVGIGAVLNMVDGYAVINGLVPGTPAELSGQLHPGDRIVALAQGDNSFIDAHSLPLEKIVQMVRGAPNTMLQLQVLPSDASPGSAPRTVALFRDQLKFKR